MMDLATSVSQITKSLKTFAETVGDFARYIKFRKSRKRLIDALNKDQNWSLASSIVLIDDDLIRYREMTYADLCRNIDRMIFVRRDMIMTLEKVLSESAPTQNEINRACAEIVLTIEVLRRLIRSFYIISQETRDANFTFLPHELHIVLSETDFALRRLVVHLNYDRTSGSYDGNVFINPSDRKQLSLLCEEFKRLLSFLCDMKVRIPANQSRPIRGKVRRKQSER
jgi:hypothetical protein